jgi:hypothetical protein
MEAKIQFFLKTFGLENKKPRINLINDGKHKLKENALNKWHGPTYSWYKDQEKWSPVRRFDKVHHELEKSNNLIYNPTKNQLQ